MPVEGVVREDVGDVCAGGVLGGGDGEAAAEQGAGAVAAPHRVDVVRVVVDVEPALEALDGLRRRVGHRHLLPPVHPLEGEGAGEAG